VLLHDTVDHGVVLIAVLDEDLHELEGVGVFVFTRDGPLDADVVVLLHEEGFFEFVLEKLGDVWFACLDASDGFLQVLQIFFMT